jgi:hypothetical protein
MKGKIRKLIYLYTSKSIVIKKSLKKVLLKQVLAEMAQKYFFQTIKQN